MGVAVKVTEVPAQMVLELALELITTDATVMVPVALDPHPPVKGIL